MSSNRDTWLGLGLLLMAAGLLGATGLFAPSAVGPQRLALALGVLALIGFGVALGLHPRSTIVLRQILLWVAASLVAATGIGFHRELTKAVGLPAAFFSDEASGASKQSKLSQEGPGLVSLRAEPGGHFFADGLVNGTFVHFLVDTGATKVALTHEDAERLKLDTKSLNYSIEVRTANGATRAAPVVLESIMIGHIEINDVPALVTEGALDQSLLGMSFLKRLASVSVDQDRLVMRE